MLRLCIFCCIVPLNFTSNGSELVLLNPAPVQDQRLTPRPPAPAFLIILYLAEAAIASGSQQPHQVNVKPVKATEAETVRGEM